MLAIESAAIALMMLLLGDVQLHRRDELALGINQFGFRGPLHVAPHPGIRVALVGGSLLFASGTGWRDTIAAQLAQTIDERRAWTAPGRWLIATDRGPYASVDNLSEPAAGPAAYARALHDYEYLHPDVVCVLDGYDSATNPVPPHGRRQSFVFRGTGYLPVLPGALLGRPGPLSDRDAGLDADLRDTSDGDPSCDGQSAAYCAAFEDTVRYALQRGERIIVATPPYASARHETQQRSLAARFERAFGSDRRFRYVNLGHAIDLRDGRWSRDGIHPNADAARVLAMRLADTVFDVIPESVHR